MFTSSQARTKNLAIGTAVLAFLLTGALLLFAPMANASGYQRISDGDAQFSNGKQTIAMQYGSGKATLYKVNNTTGATKTYRSFKTDANISWHLTYVYGKTIFLTKSDFNNWVKTTYAYNTKTKKLTKVKSKCDIEATNGGKYVVASNTYRTDVGPMKYTIYKVTKTGKMKKVKVLAKNGLHPTIIGKYIYYGAGNSGLSKLSVYRCKLNGSAKKKLGGPWKAQTYSWGASGMVLTPKFLKKYCLVTSEGPERLYYKFTYKTKKLTKITQEQYVSILTS